MDLKTVALILAALGAFTAEALPRMIHTRRCHISQYRTLGPSQRSAVQHLRSKYEETMLQVIRGCPRNLLQQKPPMHEFTVHDRFILAEQKVAMAVHVLVNISNSELSTYVSKPLEMLLVIKEHLGHCIHSGVHGSRPSARLDTWLQEFSKSKEMESQQCLEATVILNLLQMLNWDVKCAAYLELCNKLLLHHHSHSAPITANQKQE